VAAGLAVFMAMFDMTAVAIALPDVTRDLAITPDVGEWLILTYAGAMIALGLPAGRYVDRADIRGCFTLATLGFALSSAVAGLAPNIGVLVGARLVQGGFGALIAAVVPVIATRAVPLSQRGRALSIIGTLGPLGAVSGPALGGPLVDAFGWSAVFFVVVPFSIAAVVVGQRQINRLRGMPAPGVGLAVETAVVGGCFLSGFAALTLLARPDRPLGTITTLFAVSLGCLLAWWRLPGFTAVRDALRQPLVGACVLSLALATVASGTLYYLPPFALRAFHGWSPAQIGAVLLFQPLMMGITGPLAGYLSDTWNARLTAMLGLGSMILGSSLLAVGIGSWGTVGIIGCLLLTGIGLGLFAGPNQTLLMIAARPALRGTAAASSALARQFGFAVGPALATIIWLGNSSPAARSGSGSGLRNAFLVAPVAAGLSLLAFGMLSRGARGRVPTAPPPGGPHADTQAGLQPTSPGLPTSSPQPAAQTAGQVEPAS
jgi:MFS family permease